MSKTDVETIKRDLAEINGFVKERIDPVAQEVSLLSEETARLGSEVARIQERERASRREALARETGEYESPLVTDGPYSGMDVLDLGLLRRLARSQAREASGPAWMERAEAGEAVAGGERDAGGDRGVAPGGVAAAERLVHGGGPRDGAVPSRSGGRCCSR